MPSLYQILEIPETADPSAIESAFKRLSSVYDPKSNLGNPAMEAYFKEILEAYRVLSDPALRKAYDGAFMAGKASPRADILPGSPPPSPHRKYRLGYFGVGLLIVGSLVLFRRGQHEYRAEQNEMARSMPGYITTANAAGFEDLLPLDAILLDGTTQYYVDWESVIVKSYPNLRKQYLPLEDEQTKNVLHVSGENGHGSRKDWLFFRSQADKLIQVLEHDGRLTYEDHRLRMHFRHDVDTFRSCANCNVRGLPFPDVAGFYFSFRYGRFFLFGISDQLLLNYFESNIASLATRQNEVLFLREDNGFRKEFLRQFLSLHFLRNDSAATRQLFDHSYRYDDKQEVWEEIWTYIERYEGMLRKNAMIEFGGEERLHYK